MNPAMMNPNNPPRNFRMNRFAGTAALMLLLVTGVPARTWTSADGAKTFEGELKSYDPATGAVGVTQPSGTVMKFNQDKLSAADIAFLKAQGKIDAPSANKPAADKIDTDPKNLFKKPDGKPADMSKPAQVFILMGQSNMVGMGKIAGGEGSLENAVKTKNKYPYLVDEAGGWLERKDVRFVRYMSGQGPLNNEWMGIKGGTIGPEYGIGQVVGNAIDAPVMILKCCIGNRSLGWDLLPPGSERFEEGGKVYAGYKDSPDSWAKGTEPKPIGWYAGKQYDDDTADAKTALADLDKHYPGAKKYEVAGFFLWQGEKDGLNAVHASRYEKNLVAFIKALRKDFNAPTAKFVLATMGEAVKGSGNKVMEGQFAVDGATGKHPEFKGNVATVYSNPLSLGGSGNGHYNGNAETYMNVGEAMGKAMAELLKNQK
ncbi:MAG: sialate O-acetylesterase [Verrucomicrobia bacterium]|nr:sialate O-acetylesterase [Verrucomicrobiota bacterium]